MKTYLNLSAYQFVALKNPHELAVRIRAEAAARELKGTVLLAHEGINLFVAGRADEARGLMAWLQSDARLARLEAKESHSVQLAFRKLVVKVKAEIIRMNHPTIRPEQGRARSVSATTLAQWLAQGHDDQGREVLMLDARNGFEVDHGRFKGAVDWRLNQFSDFTSAAQAHQNELRNKTVVSYCTGGIRCEKAALYLQEAGIADAWQLEGGILNYLKTTQGQHFEGDCFVFDAREALNHQLKPITEATTTATATATMTEAPVQSALL
jgi:UPF0176 protein